MGSRKVVSFRHDRDILCTFNHDKTKGAPLPLHTPRPAAAILPDPNPD